MVSATLIYPHHLFQNHPTIKKTDHIIFYEDQLFFKDPIYPHNFHKKKLILHRAAMQHFYRHLKKTHHHIHYIDHEPNLHHQNLLDTLDHINCTNIFLADPTDYILKKRITSLAQDHSYTLTILPSPSFITPPNWNKQQIKPNQTHYQQTNYYIKQRKHHQILLKANKPMGGKWTYDSMNRKPLKTTQNVPKLPKIPLNKEIKKAQEYVENHFPNNPGETTGLLFPYTHQQSQNWLEHFITHRLPLFGDYQDAIHTSNQFLYHSLLSSSLNCGLLTPNEIITQTLKYHQNKTIPLNSLEGFIRQLIGWREFFHALYQTIGTKQRTSNFWNHQYAIPDSFYKPETKILPIDITISNVLNNAYAHHIERLMILGNFMMLCEIHPTAVYQWFMDLFIDSYDWVMVPNCYGMSQFADGGLITTKPYLSSSRYILKMSNYKKGPWCDTWDGLFWRFINKHQTFFSSNPRMNMMVSIWNKMEKSKKKNHLLNAENFLQKIHS